MEETNEVPIQSWEESKEVPSESLEHTNKVPSESLEEKCCTLWTFGRDIGTNLQKVGKDKGNTFGKHRWDKGNIYSKYTKWQRKYLLKIYGSDKGTTFWKCATGTSASFSPMSTSSRGTSSMRYTFVPVEFVIHSSKTLSGWMAKILLLMISSSLKHEHTQAKV